MKTLGKAEISSKKEMDSDPNRNTLSSHLSPTINFSILLVILSLKKRNYFKYQLTRLAKVGMCYCWEMGKFAENLF